MLKSAERDGRFKGSEPLFKIVHNYKNERTESEIEI